jgi:hypothetical protein
MYILLCNKGGGKMAYRFLYPSVLAGAGNNYKLRLTRKRKRESVWKKSNARQTIRSDLI